mmetsp:Transcript_28637/g.77241  ORF Transcript_28637/g.77241 Transcript_28637/m.77241 type:complete len:219 (-) Transcript_28637:977-1633(-)
MLACHPAWVGNVEVRQPGQGTQTLAQVRLVGGGHESCHARHAMDGCHAQDALLLVLLQRLAHRHRLAALPLSRDFAHCSSKRARQLMRILNGHAPALTQVGLHCVCAVPQQSHTAFSPAEDRGPVVHVTPQHVSLWGGLNEVHHIIVPMPKQLHQPRLALTWCILPTGRLFVEGIPLHLALANIAGHKVLPVAQEHAVGNELNVRGDVVTDTRVHCVS